MASSDSLWLDSDFILDWLGRASGENKLRS